MSKVRGLRGATTANENGKEAILEATTELLTKLVDANKINLDDVAAAFFTTTHDLNVEFPAVAARKIGWTSVALMCGHEMQVPDGLPKCVRVLILLNTDKAPRDLVHVYLRGATHLRDRGMENKK